MKKLDINENTSIGLPLRNLIGLISAILIGAWFAFGVIERLNKLETADTLFQADLLKKAEQEPKNLEMFMLIEHLASQIESIEKEIEASRYNKVNIDHLKEHTLMPNVSKCLEKKRVATRNSGVRVSYVCTKVKAEVKDGKIIRIAKDN